MMRRLLSHQVIVFSLLSLMCSIIFAALPPSNQEIKSSGKIRFVHQLDASKTTADPMDQFLVLFKKVEHRLYLPATFILSTVQSNDRPNARLIMLRGVNKDGFIFATNPKSNTMLEINNNPNAMMSFVWLAEKQQIAYQVQIAGQVSSYKETPDFHRIEVNGEAHTVPWQYLILKPDYIKFSQGHRSSNASAIEYVLYEKKDNHWIKSTPDDYLRPEKLIPPNDGLNMSCESDKCHPVKK